MKNGLRRFQFYLTEENYRKFEAEFLEFNKEREERSDLKLSESGFCQLKLTGDAPLPRGAPKGNKNALGRKAKPLLNVSVNNFSNASDKVNPSPENQQSDTNDFAQTGTTENRAELSPASGISDDENIRSNNQIKSVNFATKIPVNSTAFQEENPPKDLPAKMPDLSGGESLMVKEHLTAKIIETAREDLQFSDEEIEATIESIGSRNRVRS